MFHYLFNSLTFTYKAYISYLNHAQTATAILAGNFLVFYNNLGRQLVRHRKRTVLFCFVLCWFGVIVVYITPTKLRKSYLQILSALLQNWIFLSRSCHHPTRSCVFYLLQLQFLQHLYSIYKDIRSGHLVQYYPDL